jgi:hypothetical protein
MKRLFLTWQDKESRKWYPVGELQFNDGVYRFFYLKGAEDAKSKANFQPLVSFPDFREVYESSDLFPMFSNRVMPRSRPDYQQVIEFLALQESDNDPLAFLARTGGAKVTDQFEIFCFPELDSNSEYHLNFFAHGLRYLPSSSIERISKMQSGDQIFVALDLQNSFEKNALLLHTKDNYVVGYCPSYLLDDLAEYVPGSFDFEVMVERVNNGSSPLQFRLLCRIVFPQTSHHRPFTSKAYSPVVSTLTTLHDPTTELA